MCELLGLSFNRNVRPKFSLNGLLAGADHNCHGWGIGCYPSGSHSACVIKEPVQGNQSGLAGIIGSRQSLKSKIFISHIRRTSGTPVCYDNTHPFNRFYCRREWIFAHNGSLQIGNIGRLKFFPIGQTDSELAFCHLLSEMSRGHFRTTRKREFTGLNRNEIKQIHEILKKINRSGSGSLNCLFSDGRLLFAFRDVNGSRPLYYLKRHLPFHFTCFRGQDIQVNLNSEKSADESGFIAASQPLSDENWISFAPGEMMVFDWGRRIYP